MIFVNRRVSSYSLGHLHLISRFSSDERTFPPGSGNSADNKKTDNTLSRGVEKSAEGRNFGGIFCWKVQNVIENRPFSVYVQIRLDSLLILPMDSQVK